jgi:hypothetical protein
LTKIKHKVTFGKKPDLKTNRILETDKTLNENCLKEFSMRTLKVLVVMNKAKSFKDFYFWKDFCARTKPKKTLNLRKIN